MTPVQAKRYVANRFRENSKETDLVEIDSLIDEGYELLHEAEWHLTHDGYIISAITKCRGNTRNKGIDRFEDQRGDKRIGKPSSFLKDFYKGSQTHYDE